MPRLLDWATDYIHMIRGGTLMFFRRRPPTHYRGYILPGKAPVVIIPGIGSRWGFLKPLGDYISLKGHPVYIVPSLGHNLSAIPKASRKVREVIEQADLRDVILVGHSKGGLIGKYLLTFDNQDHRAKGLVSLATPYSGTELVRRLPSWAFGEFHPENPLVLQLQAESGINPQIISIFPEWDNHVWGEAGSYLEGALENIKVPVRGHHKVVYDKSVWENVASAIDRLTKS